MVSSTFFLRSSVAALAVAASAFATIAAHAEEEFPFGFEMTMEVAPQPGTKRMPTLEIGDNGEATLDLWCKHGKGQFSVAGNTVIFMPGAMEDRGCTPDRAAVDDDTIAALGQAATWKRQGDLVTFVGTRPVRFRINTN
jgi:heat shock protein HslJ